MRWSLCIALLAACGRSAPPPAHGPTIQLAAPPGVPDDLQVATVNGRPVWGSCIQAQAARGASRADARDQCIAFELLAQAAEARGLERSPEAAEALKTALVSRLVELDFETKYRTPADLAGSADALLKGAEWRLNVPEIRSSTFARFVVPPNAGFGVESKAKVMAQELYDGLAGETGLFGSHLREAAQRIATDPAVKLTVADPGPKIAMQLAKPYADALFAIPDVGRVAPPVRTKWGWDVILLTDRIPARNRTREEFAADVFPALRRHQFVVWEQELEKSLGLHIEKHDDLLAQQEEDQ